MGECAIEARGLGKRYTIGHVDDRRRDLTVREALARGARNAWRKAADVLGGRAPIAGDSTEEVWALRDVGFDIARGEIVGIIGRNGAGKSTLLKILSRITDPSCGRVTVRGRVASLLEVGTGFHPELTGRENIYLNGAILGMGRREVARKFDEIVDFAETERFLDTPVKRYSSGMYVRLAFAVAAHLESDVLMVDEVLAVGDAQFQRKCLGKMDLKAREGRTILFVSHQMTAVSGLCSRAILLDGGRVAHDGPTAEVVDAYMRGSYGEGVDVVGTGRRFEGVENDHVRLLSLRVSKQGENDRPYVTTADALEFSVDFENRVPGRNLDLTLDLYNEHGIHVCHFGTACSANSRLEGGLHRCTAVFPGGILNTGRYTVHVLFGLDQKHLLLRHDRAGSFLLEDAIAQRGVNFSRFPGVIHPPTRWRVEVLERESTA